MRHLQKNVCLVFLVIAAALIAVGCGGKPDNLTKVYALGETAEAGAFGFQVSGCDWLDRIGDGADAKTAVHRFLVIHLGVFNRSASDLAIPALALLDDNGQTYSEAPAMMADPKWLGLSRKARSNETTYGNAIFDVPPAHYRLRVADESGFDRFALIDIPLRVQTDFEAGTPR